MIAVFDVSLGLTWHSNLRPNVTLGIGVVLDWGLFDRSQVHSQLVLQSTCQATSFACRTRLMSRINTLLPFDHLGRVTCAHTPKVLDRSAMMRALQPEDSNKALIFAAQMFVDHEPMTKATGKTFSDMVELFGPISEACCSSGMSFGTFSDQEQQGDIVCVSLALPYTDFNAVQWPDVPRPAQGILRTLPKVTEQQQAASVYMFLWATHPDHMGKGYAKSAVEASIQAAKTAGYSSLVVDVTNVVSQHLALNHFGFTVMEPKARYHDHEIFKVVQCSEYIIRAVKDLGAPAGAAAEGKELQHQ